LQLRCTNIHRSYEQMNWVKILDHLKKNHLIYLKKKIRSFYFLRSGNSAGVRQLIFRVVILIWLLYFVTVLCSVPHKVDFENQGKKIQKWLSKRGLLRQKMILNLDYRLQDHYKKMWSWSWSDLRSFLRRWYWSDLKSLLKWSFQCLLWGYVYRAE
jgi:hypothetical protein